MSNDICGIVMPISPMDGCDAQHWIDVKQIISDAITAAGYEPRLVSSAAEVNIIQARIIQNLYLNPVVVCDVSCKNANVMFELGMRLAFDKPTVVIKDDQTGYSFDTSPIEHITYPRTLRHGSINKFKEELTSKIIASAGAKIKDPNFSPFLKSFGPLKAANMETKEVPAQEIMFDMLQNVISKLDNFTAGAAGMLQGSSRTTSSATGNLRLGYRFEVERLTDDERGLVAKFLLENFRNSDVNFESNDSRTMVSVRGPKLGADEQEHIRNFIDVVVNGRINRKDH